MIFSILLAITGVTIMSFGYLFQKMGLKETIPLKELFMSKHGLIWIFGTVLTFLGSFLFFIALGYGDLTVIQPITGLSPAIVTVLSLVVFGTTLHRNELIGIGASILGIIFVSYRSVPAETVFDLSPQALNYFSIITSIFIIVLVFALNYVNSLDAGLIEGVLSGITAGMASIYIKIGLNYFINQHTLHWTLIGFILMQTAAFISLQRALRHGRMDKIVTIFTNINIILPVGFGILLLGEMVNFINIFGMLLIIAGVILLAKNYSEIFDVPANQQTHFSIIE